MLQAQLAMMTRKQPGTQQQNRSHSVNNQSPLTLQGK
jgi:hypothetical protein